MRTPKTERKGREVGEAEEGSGGEETGFAGQEEVGTVEEEEGDTASTCSLGNLSNLKSCQDADRRCTAGAPPHPASTLATRANKAGKIQTREALF